MRIPVQTLRDAALREFTDAGIPPAEAAVGVDMCIDAELRGHTSHGLRLVRNVLAEYALGGARRGEMRILNETASSARIDAGFHMSLFAHQFAVDLAATKARDTGVAIVSVANAGVAGALG